MDRELVKFIRIIHGMTQYEFGRFIGYSRSYVMMIERGFRDLSNNYEEKIMRTFNLTIEDILKLKELSHTKRKVRKAI